jgi:hypothetical protein
MAILIYDGRDAGDNPDSNHGKILLASEHVPYESPPNSKTFLPREYNVFGGSIEPEKDKCPLQTLYDEVAEEGRFLEIGKKVEDSKPFKYIFKSSNDELLTEPCVHQKALYFIGVVKRGMSIWDVDGVKYNPGKAIVWDGNAAKLTGIFAKINVDKSGGAFVRTYGEKNEFRFFNDDEIARNYPTMFSQTRNILQNAEMKNKIAEVRKKIGIAS